MALKYPSLGQAIHFQNEGTGPCQVAFAVRNLPPNDEGMEVIEVIAYDPDSRVWTHWSDCVYGVDWHWKDSHKTDSPPS